MAQSVKHPTSAQVMISRFLSSSPTSGSELTAQSLEPASDSVSPSLSAPPPLVLSLSLSLSLSFKNILTKTKTKSFVKNSHFSFFSESKISIQVICKMCHIRFSI